MSDQSNIRPSQIVALPNGGTAIWIGNANGNLADDICDALSMAGVGRDDIDVDAALADHQSALDEAAVQAEAGLLRMSGEAILLRHKRQDLPSGRAFGQTLMVGNVRGRECLMFVLGVAETAFTVATAGEADLLSDMVLAAARGARAS